MKRFALILLALAATAMLSGCWNSSGTAQPSPTASLAPTATADNPVEGALDEGCVEAFRQGVPLADFTAKSANLSIEAPGTALVEVFEGKYHQVKRMFAAIGHPVVALERLRIGEVWLDSALAPGESRPLTAQEAESLYRAVRLDPAHQD